MLLTPSHCKEGRQVSFLLDIRQEEERREDLRRNQGGKGGKTSGRDYLSCDYRSGHDGQNYP